MVQSRRLITNVLGCDMHRQHWIWLSAGCAAIAAGTLLWPSDTPDGQVQPVAAAAHKASDAWGPSPFGDAEEAESASAHRHITDPLPPVLFARSGRIVDLHGLSAVEFIAQWSSRARTGDAEAAYKVFQAADLCAEAGEPLPDTQSNTDRQALLHERDELEHVCANVTPAQIAERMNFLDAAARAGQRDAQVDYYMEGPDGNAVPGSADDDAAIAQWKIQSLSYLKSAASSGDTFSLGLLANAYDAGLITPPDPKLALAYSVADMLARNVSVTPTALRNRYGSQLPDAEFAAGMQLGQQIAAGCCAGR